MNDEAKLERNWWKRNWKWGTSITLLFFICMCILSIISSLGVGDNIIGFGEVLSDSSIYDNALEKARKNERVIEVMGELDPISSLAIIEGDVGYTNNKNSIVVTIKITGSKASGSIDIIADRNGIEWQYRKINIRIKNPKEKKETIEIINSTQ
ncbi:cytochrome c oxidase assembly factor Coa1 family protein [Aquimarina sp. 2304DJ70-9]|uniref:cytochrome c oxidase assembly factor Coa1 family protein n=1 Tax=Aquimarina penaris TaxID=3231044 RepID=UPI003461A585